MAKCGYCNKELPKDLICKEIDCWYRGMKQLSKRSIVPSAYSKLKRGVVDVISK